MRKRHGRADDRRRPRARGHPRFCASRRRASAFCSSGSWRCSRSSSAVPPSRSTC
jgi:hypothetical protein